MRFSARTGQERDEESGLSFHGARYFSPATGRWCSCDPVAAAPSRSAYEYAGSRPIARVDVDGKEDKAPKLSEDYPIYVGETNSFTSNLDYKFMDVLTGQRDRSTPQSDTSYRTLNRVGLRSYLTDLVSRSEGDVGRELTVFERKLVAEWGKDPTAVLVPLFVSGVGVFGYEHISGGSGDRLHRIYNRVGDNLLESHTELPLVNKGLGPIDYALAAWGIGSAARWLVGRWLAKRAAGRLALAAAEEEAESLATQATKQAAPSGEPKILTDPPPEELGPYRIPGKPSPDPLVSPGPVPRSAPVGPELPKDPWSIYEPGIKPRK